MLRRQCQFFAMLLKNSCCPCILRRLQESFRILISIRYAANNILICIKQLFEINILPNFIVCKGGIAQTQTNFSLTAMTQRFWYHFSHLVHPIRQTLATITKSFFIFIYFKNISSNLYVCEFKVCVPL